MTLVRVYSATGKHRTSGNILVYLLIQNVQPSTQKLKLFHLASSFEENLVLLSQLCNESYLDWGSQRHTININHFPGADHMPCNMITCGVTGSHARHHDHMLGNVIAGRG